MKTNSSHLSNLTILFDLGFSGTSNPMIFVRKSGIFTHRVLFLAFGKVQVDSSRGGNTRSKVWTLDNFVQVLALLETLGVQ